MTNPDFPIHGVFAAVLTPLDGDLVPDLPRMVAHATWLLENGCDGLGILGTTGEANSFSVAERVAILEGLAEAGVPAGKMMPGTGCCAISDTVELTRKALELGAASVLMLPPFFYKNQSEDGLFAAYAEVIERVGDTRLKVNLYHFPQMSGVPVTYGLIERLLKAYPDTIYGMKDSSGDFENMAGAAKAFPGFAVFSGSDSLLLPMLRVGGAGCITACANVASSLAQAVYQEYRSHGDTPRAEDLMGPLKAARDVISNHPLIPALKALVARHRDDPGWLHMRPPVMQLDQATVQALFGAYDGAGLTLPDAA